MSLVLLSVALAADISVTTTDDVSADDGLCSLREAVEAANTDTASGSSAGECGAGGVADTITLPAGTYLLDNGELDLDEPTTILGDGSGTTIIDAQDLSRCIASIVGGSIHIEGLTCRNGNSTGGAGGGMNFRDLISQVSQGNTLTLRDVVVEDCATNEDGGGIATKGYALTTFEDVVLQRNYADDDGGGLSIPDTADPNAVAYDIDGLQLLDNEAGDDGGGFEGYLGPDATFSGWVVSGNVAADRAGGLYLWGGSNNVRLENSSIVDNTAGGEGGAIWNDITLELSNLLITGNQAAAGGVLNTESSVEFDHVTAVGNTATVVGAGIIVNDFLTIRMRNSIFTDNSDGGSYAEGCGAYSYYFSAGYGIIFDSQGGNVLPTTGWDCDIDGTDVLSDDPDLGTLTVNADGQYEYPTNLTSPARGLSTCDDPDGQTVATDLLGEARPSTACTAGAYQAAICGDGVVTDDEECDDGGTADDDGCSSVCAIEEGYVCSGTPSDCLLANDTDQDGWSDELEGLCGADPDDDGSVPADNDGDGLCDDLDGDDDDDGWADDLELLCGTDETDDTSVPADTDTDGLCDTIDSDADGDGVDSVEEALCGTSDLDDTDLPTYTDGDALCDAIDDDDDGDGWTDRQELLCGTDTGSALDLPTDTDSNGVCDTLDSDDDGDGSLDATETACGSDTLDAGSVPTDFDIDGDGTCDALDPCPDDALDDSDSDGSCDSVDLCTGDDTTGDADGDGTCADGDCDDDDDTRYPGAMDTCDGVDSDCDGTDEVDGDNDGALSCDDCDDNDDTRFPGAFEVDGDGIDSDCDGFERCFVDDDDDGARTTTVLVSDDTTCATAGLALASAPYDCDDTDDTLEQLDLDVDGWSTCAGDCDDDDDTLVSCDDLHLSDASVPVASQTAEFTLFGADPLAEVVLVRGRLGEVTTLTKCAIDIPLGDAVIARRWDADALGEAVIPKQMPPNPGLNGYMAIDPVACTVSNVITQQVHDDGL